MTKLFLLTVLVMFLFLAAPALAGDVSNFFTPYGFRTPVLEQGQLAVNFNPHYFRQEYRLDAAYGFAAASKSIFKQYNFSFNGVYALTDELVFQGSLVLYPGQRRQTDRYVWNWPDDHSEEHEIRQHSNFTMVPSVQVSFRPQTNVQFYGDFYLSKEKGYEETEDEERASDLKRDNVYFNLGFTILGRLSAGKPTERSGYQIFNFLRPYGFRTPMLSQSQYAVNISSFYTRTESTWDSFFGSEQEMSTWTRYYFSLNGLYAITRRLLFQGSLDIYPGQTRETYDRVGVGSRLNYDEMRSDFAVFPRLVASVRPKLNMEFYGVFLFTRENLHKIRESGLQSDVSEDYYYFDFGYTILLKSSRDASGPIPGSEFSNFFTPYGFRTPLLEQGQGALNVNFHHDRTESEEHHPRSLEAIDTRSTRKRYYFSLNWVYAASDELIVEPGLDVFPGQTRVTDRLKWYSDVSGSSGGRTDEQHSHFAVSPRLEGSFRPQTNVEFYGAFYLNKEKTYIENQFGQRSKNSTSEYFYLDFGFTILGDL